MRHYYKKFKKFGNRYLKVTVDDNTAGTKKDPWRIIDAFLVNEVSKNEKTEYHATSQDLNSSELLKGE